MGGAAVNLPASLTEVTCGFPGNTCWRDWNKAKSRGGVFGRGKSVGSAGKRGRVGAGRLQQVFCRVGDEWGIGSGGT